MKAAHTAAGLVSKNSAAESTSTNPATRRMGAARFFFKQALQKPQ
jgi:hypothetical protein